MIKKDNHRSGECRRIFPNPRGRSGSMLLLVLVMLAVALILITSALSITLAARQRYYKDAENEQTGLTATSAAKMIGEAAADGQFGTISDIEALADGGITYDLSSSDLTIPGLSGTTATFGWYPDSISRTYISVTVHTTLDVGINGTASQEEVMVLLKKKTINSKAFGNLITVGIENPSGDTSNNVDKLQIGTVGAGGTVVVHGDAIVGMAVQDIYCGVIFTGHTIYTANTNFYSNVIYYGDNAALVDNNGSGGGISMFGTDSNLFFFRDTRAGVFSTEAPYVNKDSSSQVGLYVEGGIYLSHGELMAVKKASDIYGGTKKGVALGPDSNTSSSLQANETDTATLQALADSLLPSTEEAVYREVLQTADPQVQALFPYKTASAVKSSGAVEITSAELSGGATKTAGSYYINILTAQTLKNDLVFDLAGGDINVYLIGGNTLNLASGKIRFTNGSAANIGKMYLLAGTDIDIKGGGIYGTASRSSSPWVYIYGLGESANKIAIEQGTLEGYVGLFGTAGTLSIQNAADIYCRYEGAYIMRESPFGPNKIEFPFCPGPATDEGGGISRTSLIIAGYVTK